MKEIPKSEIKNRIMLSLAEGMQNHGDNISSERIDEIGVALIASYASVNIAARKVGMSPARLRWLIENVPELQVYFEIAHEGVKGLTDERVIQGLIDGNEEIVKAVFSKMYAGRAKGGYNIAELGTSGYKDQLGKELAAETEQDAKRAQNIVQFNFVTKEVKHEFEAITMEDDYIEADELGQEDSE